MDLDFGGGAGGDFHAYRLGKQRLGSHEGSSGPFLPSNIPSLVYDR